MVKAFPFRFISTFVIATYPKILSKDRVKVAVSKRIGGEERKRDKRDSRGEQWLREEWNLLKSPVPHVRPIETIWSCNKPCCEPVYRLVGSETLCTASCTGHIIIMPPLTRLAVITTLPPRPLLSRGRVENSSGGITRRQPVCASRAGWFLLHVGEDGGGGRRDRMIEKERNDFFFGDCEHGVVNFLAAIVCNEAASREKKGERSGKIIDIVSGRPTFRSNVIRTLR